MNHPIGTFVQVVVLPGVRNRKRLNGVGISTARVKSIQQKQFTAEVLDHGWVRINASNGAYPRLVWLPEESVNILDY